MKQKILLVDDKEANLVALEKIIKKNKNAEVVKATSGNDALKASLEFDFALALVDIQMPEMNGYELAELLRTDEKTKYLPIIFVSAIMTDEFHAFQGYKAGGIDFIPKPFNQEILLNKISVFMELAEQRTILKDEIVKRQETEKLLREASDQQQLLLKKLEILVAIDGLTQLYNHRHIMERLHQEVAEAKRYSKALSVAMFDIDNFKSVNDTYGHQAGDLILRSVADVIREELRQTDIAGRYGGEEFFIILTNTNLEGSVTITNRIRDQISKTVHSHNGAELSVTISGGVHSLQSDIDPTELIGIVDSLLYKAKRNGKNRIETE